MSLKNRVYHAMKNPIFTAKTGIYYLILHGDLQYIKAELAKTFNEDEINNFSFGASAGMKEIALYLLIRKIKPKLMIETGVAQGISSYFILKAMRDNGMGRLISIDYPNYDRKGMVNGEGELDRTFTPKARGPGWIVPSSLRGSWKLILGKSQDVLPRTNEKFDCFMHDSEHTYKTMTFEMEWAYGHMQKGHILCDDTERNNAYADMLKRHRDTMTEVASPIAIASVNKTRN
jgi:hypothetical protein